MLDFFSIMAALVSLYGLDSLSSFLNHLPQNPGLFFSSEVMIFSLGGVSRSVFLPKPYHLLVDYSSFSTDGLFGDL
jgi:hypothetical protein